MVLFTSIIFVIYAIQNREEMMRVLILSFIQQNATFAIPTEVFNKTSLNIDLLLIYN